MRVNVAPRRRNAPRPADKSAPAFLQWLRGRECLCAKSGTCSGRMEAAHVQGGARGVGTKAADRFAVPLCSAHHREQHDRGWASFQRSHMVDAQGAAAAYWQAWPGRRSWEAANG